jgi:hypothetical protein
MRLFLLLPLFTSAVMSAVLPDIDTRDASANVSESHHDTHEGRAGAATYLAWAKRMIWNRATNDDHKEWRSPNGTALLYKPGGCKASLINYRQLWTENFKVLAWEGKLLDGNGTPIQTCAAAKKIAGVLNPFTIPCPPLGFGLSALNRPAGDFVLRIGPQIMGISDNRCQVGEWDLDAKPVPVS